MDNEFEVVSYERLRHFSIFLNKITYRNYHFHGAFEWILTLQGHGEISVGGEKFPLEPEHLVLINPFEAHEISGRGEPVLTLIFQISPHFLHEYVPELANTRFLQRQVHASLAPDAFREVKNGMLRDALTYFRQEPYFALSCAAQTAALLRQLLVELPREILSERCQSSLKQKGDRLRRISSYLETHYQEPVRLNALAEMEGLTATYVSHLISDSFGISFREYLNNLRFEKAMDYLREASMTLTEIAAASGFSDLKYLNKLFKQRTGLSLRDCRSQRFAGSAGNGAKLVQPLEYRLSEQESIGCLMEIAEP